MEDLSQYTYGELLLALHKADSLAWLPRATLEDYIQNCIDGGLELDFSGIALFSYVTNKEPFSHNHIVINNGEIEGVITDYFPTEGKIVLKIAETCRLYNLRSVSIDLRKVERKKRYEGNAIKKGADGSGGKGACLALAEVRQKLLFLLGDKN